MYFNAHKKNQVIMWSFDVNGVHGKDQSRWTPNLDLLLFWAWEGGGGAQVQIECS